MNDFSIICAVLRLGAAGNGISFGGTSATAEIWATWRRVSAQFPATFHFSSRLGAFLETLLSGLTTVVQDATPSQWSLTGRTL